MKKLLSISLLIIFLFDLFGYFPLFKFTQYTIRKEIKSLLKKSVPEDQLHLISVPVKNVKEMDWKREAKEFRYKGRMYDVVRQQTVKDTAYYYCVDDQQETELFARLDELINQQMRNDQSPFGRTAKQLLKMFGSCKYLSSGNFVFLQDNQQCVKDNFYYAVSCTPVFIEVPTPPPNLIA